MKKRKVSSANAVAYWILACIRMQIDSYLSLCTKLKSKYMKYLNINRATQSLTEKKVRSSLEHMSTGNHFLNRTLVVQALRATIDKWDLLKLRSFCKVKNIVNKTNWQPTESSPTPHLTEG